MSRESSDDAAAALRARLDALRAAETKERAPNGVRGGPPPRLLQNDAGARREARFAAERARLAGPQPGPRWWVGETAFRAAFAAAAVAAVLILGATIGRAETRSQTGAPHWQVEGPVVEGPTGWTRFCAAEPGACASGETRPGATATLTPDGFAALQRFNAAVNAAYTPATDVEAHGVVDLWSLPGPATGWRADCEDYVLAKRAALLEAGWPPEAVLIAVVEGTDSPYHAVLVLRTSMGELVLDNLTDDVLPWDATGYAWVVRQSARSPRRWVRLAAG